MLYNNIYYICNGYIYILGCSNCMVELRMLLHSIGWCFKSVKKGPRVRDVLKGIVLLLGDVREILHVSAYKRTLLAP